jgi:acetyl-CoA carboxylase alpha subunit
VPVATDKGYSEAAWETVQIARHPERPQTLDYIAETLPDFMELGGDRLHGNDRAIVAGLATLGKQRIVLIGHQKGHTLKEAIAKPCAWPGWPRSSAFR